MTLVHPPPTPLPSRPALPAEAGRESMADHQFLVMTGPPGGGCRVSPSGAGGVYVVVRLGPPAARTGSNWLRGL